VFYKKKNDDYYFYTNRKINKGEELLIDYNTFDFKGKKDFESKLKRLRKN